MKNLQISAEKPAQKKQWQKPDFELINQHTIQHFKTLVSAHEAIVKINPSKYVSSPTAYHS